MWGQRVSVRREGGHGEATAVVQGEEANLGQEEPGRRGK